MARPADVSTPTPAAREPQNVSAAPNSQEPGPLVPSPPSPADASILNPPGSPSPRSRPPPRCASRPWSGRRVGAPECSLLSRGRCRWGRARAPDPDQAGQPGSAWCPAASLMTCRRWPVSGLRRQGRDRGHVASPAPAWWVAFISMPTTASGPARVQGRGQRADRLREHARGAAVQQAVRLGVSGDRHRPHDLGARSRHDRDAHGCCASVPSAVVTAMALSQHLLVHRFLRSSGTAFRNTSAPAANIPRQGCHEACRGADPEFRPEAGTAEPVDPSWAET